MTHKSNTSQNPSTSLVSKVISLTSTNDNKTKLGAGDVDQGDMIWKTGEGRPCSHSLLAECHGIRKEVEDGEKVHWEPPHEL